MRLALMAAVAVLGFGFHSAFAAETFDQAWQTRWRPQVEGSFLSRRFEPQIKAACEEVWDVAQANVAPKPAGPLVAKNKATARVSTKAKAKSKSIAFMFQRRRIFRRR